MKIIEVEPLLVDRYLFLKIHTDAGITGKEAEDSLSINMDMTYTLVQQQTAAYQPWAATEQARIGALGAQNVAQIQSEADLTKLATVLAAAQQFFGGNNSRIPPVSYRTNYGGGFTLAVGGETYVGVNPKTLIRVVEYAKQAGKYPIRL